MASGGGRRARAAIREAGVSIYDDLSARPDLVYDIVDLEVLLNEALVGARWDLPIRTRSKVAKGPSRTRSATPSHPRSKRLSHGSRARTSTPRSRWLTTSRSGTRR